MKISRLILITLLVSAYATVSVINIELAKPKDVSEVTVDMLDVMSRAFDESEGGETTCPGLTKNEIYANYFVGTDCEFMQPSWCYVHWVSDGILVDTYEFPYAGEPTTTIIICVPDVIVN